MRWWLWVILAVAAVVLAVFWWLSELDSHDFRERMEMQGQDVATPRQS